MTSIRKKVARKFVKLMCEKGFTNNTFYSSNQPSLFKKTGFDQQLFLSINFNVSMKNDDYLFIDYSISPLLSMPHYTYTLSSESLFVFVYAQGYPLTERLDHEQNPFDNSVSVRYFVDQYQKSASYNPANDLTESDLDNISDSIVTHLSQIIDEYGFALEKYLLAGIDYGIVKAKIKYINQYWFDLINKLSNSEEKNAEAIFDSYKADYASYLGKDLINSSFSQIIKYWEKPYSYHAMFQDTEREELLLPFVALSIPKLIGNKLLVKEDADRIGMLRDCQYLAILIYLTGVMGYFDKPYPKQ